MNKIETLLSVGCFFFALTLPIRAQETKESWQRVYTGEDSAIDLNVSSVRFDAGHILRTKFRTLLAKAEGLKEKPGAKYKTRLETIEFNYAAHRYRIGETSLLNSKGETVQSYEANASEDWRVLKDGGIMRRLFDAARQLPPLGEWKVVDVRFAEGLPKDSQEFTRLVGTRVRLTSDRAEVGMKACSLPAYHSKLVTDKEFFEQLGVHLDAIDIKASHAETTVVKCEGTGWAPSQSLLVNVPEGGMLMLWEGVFLVLKIQH